MFPRIKPIKYRDAVSLAAKRRRDEDSRCKEAKEQRVGGLRIKQHKGRRKEEEEGLRKKKDENRKIGIRREACNDRDWIVHTRARDVRRTRYLSASNFLHRKPVSLKIKSPEKETNVTFRFPFILLFLSYFSDVADFIRSRMTRAKKLIGTLRNVISCISLVFGFWIWFGYSILELLLGWYHDVDLFYCLSL